MTPHASGRVEQEVNDQGQQRATEGPAILGLPCCATPERNGLGGGRTTRTHHAKEGQFAGYRSVTAAEGGVRTPSVLSIDLKVDPK